MALRYRYVGEGAFLPGVPARDITDEDMSELEDPARAILAEHMQLEEGRIYEAVVNPSRGRPGPAGLPVSTGPGRPSEEE